MELNWITQENVYIRAAIGMDVRVSLTKCHNDYAVTFRFYNRTHKMLDAGNDVRQVEIAIDQRTDRIWFRSSNKGFRLYSNKGNIKGDVAVDKTVHFVVPKYKFGTINPAKFVGEYTLHVDSKSGYCYIDTFKASGAPA